MPALPSATALPAAAQHRFGELLGFSCVVLVSDHEPLLQVLELFCQLSLLISTVDSS